MNISFLLREVHNALLTFRATGKNKTLTAPLQYTFKGTPTVQMFLPAVRNLKSTRCLKHRVTERKNSFLGIKTIQKQIILLKYVTKYLPGFPLWLTYDFFFITKTRKNFGIPSAVISPWTYGAHQFQDAIFIPCQFECKVSFFPVCSSFSTFL